MAIVARIHVSAAGQDDHDRLQHAVEVRLEQVGAPPDGLLVHVGYPHDDGLMVVEAWRTEQLFRSYFDDVLLPALREAGLETGPVDIAPAWSIARP